MRKKSLFSYLRKRVVDNIKCNFISGSRNIGPNNLLDLVKTRVENKNFNSTTGILEEGFSDVAYVGCTFKEIQFKNIRFSNVSLNERHL